MKKIEVNTFLYILGFLLILSSANTSNFIVNTKTPNHINNPSNNLLNKDSNTQTTSGSASFSCNGLVYNNYCYTNLIEGLGLYDKVYVSFTGSNQYAGISVEAMDENNCSRHAYGFSSTNISVFVVPATSGAGFWYVPYFSSYWCFFFVSNSYEAKVYGYTTNVAGTVTGYDLSQPTITINNPVNASTVHGLITISGTPWDATGITNVWGTVENQTYIINLPAETSSFTWSFDTTKYSNGKYIIYLIANDTSNNRNYFFYNYYFYINNPDIIPPTVSILSPSNLQTVSGMVNITLSALDNIGVSSVKYNIDGGTWITNSTTHFSWLWDSTKVSNGLHSINAEAFDAAGNHGNTEINVTVNNPISTTTQNTQTTITHNSQSTSGTQTSQSPSSTNVNSNQVSNSTTTKSKGLLFPSPGFEGISLISSFFLLLIIFKVRKRS